MKKSILLVTLSLILCNCMPTAISPSQTEYKIDKPEIVEFKQVKLETIVILGSSTASGTGASQYKYSWAGLLRNTIKNGQVINLAVGGYTTYHILPDNMKRMAYRPASDTLRNITAALKRNPTTLIISMTTNDVANGYNLDEVMDNLATVRAKAFAAGVKKVIITTSHPRNMNLNATAQLMRQRDRIIKTYSKSAVNFFDPVADSANLFKYELLNIDGIHPNDDGHEVLYEQIRKVLKL